MKRPLLVTCFFFLLTHAFCQTPAYWQQQVNNKITVSLNDADQSIDGFISMDYRNNSNDTLRFIWFHIWPNAYKNDKTAFSDQQLENGSTEFYFSKENKRGYINRLDFKVDGITATVDDHPQHQDIIKLLLPVPLAPKQSINIQTPFHVKLPDLFSRSGYTGNAYQVTQWYPKPAVYDKKGWHEMPYLDQGEFYSEFGNFDVKVTVPDKYKVAATGLLIDETKNSSSKTLHYQQNNVHDFAWFADSAFVVSHDTLQLASRTIDVYAYYHKENAGTWKNSIAFIKDAVKTKSKWLGEYPYGSVSVVESRESGDGGMEYPTITVVSNPGNEKLLDYLINHEVGHNWFYGILASNERAHPWMDEGMNSYYDNRYNQWKYKTGNADYLNGVPSFIKKRFPDDLETFMMETLTSIKKDQPIETPSEKFSQLNYVSVAYTKAAQWMALLEKEMGSDPFNNLMQEYFKRWKFKHPYPEDFKSLAEEISGKNMDHLFARLNTKGNFINPVKKGIKVAAFISMKETTKRNDIFISPAIGFNNYDKFMVGGMIHNYTAPPSRFQFLVSPLYGTGSKTLNGIGRLSYHFFPGNNGQKAEFSISGAKFTADNYTDSTGKMNNLSFNKIVPSIKFVFANRDPRSTLRKSIQWKTFFISETSLLFQRDTILQKDVISYPVETRYLNQLQLMIENNRVLYPYDATFQAEQGEGFVRLNLTGNYFFNYATGGGMNVRFFAGKFFYTGDQDIFSRYETDRYHLNMSGPKGNEDYTYSNYFIGRNDFRYALYDPNISLTKNIFRGIPGQQIMQRDGFFKVRTDLLSNKVGRTDDWLAAINFTTTIPKKINPLELLPFKIPLKIFVDIGTYAEAWDRNSNNDRFLYDAGFQLSLFRNVVNIYFPILYSKVYSDYFKSTITEKRFLKNISLSIDLQNASLRKLIPQIPF